MRSMKDVRIHDEEEKIRLRDVDGHETAVFILQCPKDGQQKLIVDPLSNGFLLLSFRLLYMKLN